MKSFKLPYFTDRKKSWSLSEKEMLFLDMSLVISRPNYELYGLIFPEVSSAQCKARSSALITSYDGKEYLELRTKNLISHFYPENTETKKEYDKDGFSVNFKDRVIQLLENELNNPSSPNYSDALKMAFNKIAKDFDKDAFIEPPRRYLPENCSSCRYKLFVESNLQIDQCKICRYKKFSNDNGVFYSYKNQLDTNSSYSITEEPENPEKSRDVE